MLEELTVGSVYSTIMMQDPVPRAVLLVEGPDDDMMLGEHLQRGVIGIVCGSRQVVIGAAEVSEQSGLRNVFGLVDRDLVPEVTGGELLPVRVVTTRAYDLTADIAAARPGAVKMAVSTHAFREARIVSRVRGHDIEEAVFQVASAYAGVRIAVLRSGYPVRLEDFDFSSIVGQQFEMLGVEVFAAHLRITRPKDFSWNDTILNELRVSMSNSAGNRELCGGHDMAAVAFGLVTAAGAKNFSRRSFEAAIRVHATCDLLASLQCIRELQSLCIASTGAEMFDCVEVAA